MEVKLRSSIPSRSANKVSVCNVFRYVQISSVSCYMARFTALLCSLQKLPSNGGECMFINMLTFCLSFHSMAAKLLLTLLFVTQLQFHCMSKILWHPFSIQSNSPTAVYFLVCKLSDGDEKILSMYNVCPTFSILTESSVTVTCVSVMEGVTCFPSLPAYTVIL